MITDTHAHLYYPEISKHLGDILSRAADNGVARIIVPAVDLASSRTIIEMSEKNDMIYCAPGIHPSEANKAELKDLDEIEKLLNHQKVVAIGETGLDYYWDMTYIDKQKTFFSLQIELAKDHKLPVVIHTRSSTDDAIRIIKENYDENLRGQFHCFSGTIKQLSEILDLPDFYVSYCGNLTYKNFSGMDVIKQTPLDRILSETDSPFLPPVPYRGKKNEPSYIIHTLQKISEIKEVGYEELLKSIEQSVNKLFF